MVSSNEEIASLLARYESESKALKKTLYRLCWYMRGGISLEELYLLGFQEREIIVDLIKENLDITKESKLPFF